MKKIISFLCLFLLIASSIAKGKDTPSKIFGKYENKHEIYFNCEHPKKNQEYCTRMVTDTLSIKPLKGQKYRAVEVRIFSVAADFHTCDYEGTGNWSHITGRLETDAGEENGNRICPMVFIFHGNSVQSVIQDQESCMDFCGARNSLDGGFFKKVRRKY